MKFYVETLGCKVNAYESEFIKESFKNNNYIEADSMKDASVVVVNTCTVTNQADAKSRKLIRQVKRENPTCCLVVCGCAAENHKENLIDLDIDILLGNKDKSKIVLLVNDYLENKKKIVNFYDLRNATFEDMQINNFEGHTRGFVKIQDGCNNFCSYCIIPFMRGSIRSKPLDVAIDEINCLVSSGYKEIVLTGIHTGNYGVDINTNFASLLKSIVKIKNLKRLRISSIEITEITDEVISIIKDNNIIVDHLHIPLQAGSDEVLKLMNRKYDLDYYYRKIESIRKVRPNISITTDVIVGFPGEDDNLFKKTIEVCRKLEFAKIHVFPFSLRSGTKAEKLPNHIENTIKKKRSRELLEVSKELEIKYFSKFIDNEVEVLIEEYKDGYSYGHTSNFLYVKIKDKLKHNEFYKVKIEKVDYPYCIGKII